MKLRNKKTGEITELRGIFSRTDKPDFVIESYNSLAELNEEWCDYEGPKEYWYIDCYGMVLRALYNDNEWDERRKLIGNCFETEGDAEKAEKKLQAWTRLKDKGFRFDGYDVAHNSNGDLCGQLFYNAGDYCIEDVEKDLDICFGGEE